MFFVFFLIKKQSNMNEADCQDALDGTVQVENVIILVAIVDFFSTPTNIDG